MATYVIRDPSTGADVPVYSGKTPTSTGTQTAPAGTITGGTAKTPEAVSAKHGSIGDKTDASVFTTPTDSAVKPGKTGPVAPLGDDKTGMPQDLGVGGAGYDLGTTGADYRPFNNITKGAYDMGAPVAVEPGMLAFDEGDEEEASELAPTISLRPQTRPTGLVRSPTAPEGFGIDSGLLGEVPTTEAPEGFGIEPAPVAQPETMGSNAVLSQKEQEYALPDNYLHVMWQIESSSGADLTGNASSAAGHFAFMPATAEQYGLEDPNDLEQSADAAARLARDNAEVIAPVLGRAPTGPELYLAHQQGAYGARAILQNPDAPATEVLGYDAVAANLPADGPAPEDLTAGEFMDYWNDRYWSKAAEAAAVQGWSGSPENDGGRPSEPPQVADATTASDGVPHASSASTASQPQVPAFSRANPTPGPVPSAPYGLGGVMAFYDEGEPQPVPYGLESPSVVHAPTSRRYVYNPATMMIEEA